MSIMKSTKISRRQEQILQFIRTQIQQRGIVPTIRIQLVENNHWRTRLSELGLQQDAGHEDVVAKLLEGLEAYDSREVATACAGAWVVRCLANPESVAGGILLEAILEQRRAKA